MRDALELMVNKTQGWVGLPMKSKCLKYDAPSSTCIPLGQIGKQQWGPIAYQEGNGYTTTVTYSTSQPIITTNIVTTSNFNRTKTDTDGKELPLEAYRTADDNILTKDIYGTVLIFGFLKHRSCAALC